MTERHLTKSSNFSNFSVDDIPLKKIEIVQLTGWYKLRKYIGVFIPTSRLGEIQQFLTFNTFIKTKNIILTTSKDEWNYTMIYYKIEDYDSSKLIEIKKLLSLPLKIETADHINDLSDLMEDHICHVSPDKI